MMTNNEQLAIDNKQSTGGLRFFAQLISYVFHPLFIPLYFTLFVMYVHPSYFSGMDLRTKFWCPLIVAQLTFFYPLLSVLLMKGLGFVDSVFLKTQKERIIPYMAAGIFYFWAARVFIQQQQYPSIMGVFMAGILFSSFAALLANIYYKISMHAIGVGGGIGIFLIIMQTNTMLMTWPLCIMFLIAGLVCTSRFLVSNHTQKDIYSGLLVGMLAQIVGAYLFL